VWWLAGSAVVLLGYLLAPTGTVKTYGFLVIGFSCIAVSSAALRRTRSLTGPWWWLLGGLACLFGGDAIYTVLSVRGGTELPFPSLADAVYLLAYPVMAVGLLRLVRARTGGSDRGNLVDASIVTVSAGVLSWVFLMAPQAADGEMSLPAKLVSLAYPLGDVLLLGVLARLALLPGRAHPVLRLLAVGLFVLVAADTAYGVTVLSGTYSEGGLIDVGFLVWYVLVTAAVLHPQMGELTQPLVLQHQRLSYLRLAALTGASLLPPVLLAVQSWRGAALEVPVVVGATIALFLLVLIRMTGLVHEVDDARRALQATLCELQAAQAERRGLLDRTLRAAEEERKRLAAELHDGPIQRLIGLGYCLDRAAIALQRSDAETAARLVQTLQTELSDETRGLRRVMASLRPPALEQRGLLRAVQDHLTDFAARTGVRVQTELQAGQPVNPNVETALFRVVQEATRNVEKHARASSLHVALIPHQRGLRLQVSDDGCGFDPAARLESVDAGHYGLIGMRERVEMAGGTWTLISSPGGGTTVSAELVEDSR